MVQVWERYKPLQLISPINTDHAMFIWRGKPVLSFSKKFSRYQNSEILCCLNVISLSFSYGQSKFNMDWNFFFFQDCWLTCLLGCLAYNLESAMLFAILEK